MANTQTTDELVIDLSATRKKRYRIEGVGDNTSVLELNTSDLSVITRLNEAYPRLEALDKKVAEMSSIGDEDDSLQRYADELSDIDSEMRALIDFIFDSNISEVCCPSGSMYDPFSGHLRWEHILDNIIKCYDTQMNIEMKKIKQQSKSHTAKYTK